MAWYKVAPPVTGDENFIKRVKAGSQTLCLIRLEGKLYATSSRCPHAGADLSTGWCEHKEIICPYHRYSYNLHTGKGSPGQNDYISVYEVDYRDDGVYVQVHSVWDKLKRVFG